MPGHGVGTGLRPVQRLAVYNTGWPQEDLPNQSYLRVLRWDRINTWHNGTEECKGTHEHTHTFTYIHTCTQQWKAWWGKSCEAEARKVLMTELEKEKQKVNRMTVK